MTTSVFLHIDRSEIGAWRASRIYMACRWFARTTAPSCEIAAKYIDHERVGWTFWMPTPESRDELIAYYDMIMRAPS